MDLLFKLGFFILGGVAVLIYQFFQTKEELKQILYKEKLVLYEQIVNCVHDLILEIDNYLSDKARDKLTTLAGAINQLQRLTIRKNYLYNEKIYSVLKELSEDASKAFSYTVHTNKAEGEFDFKKLKEKPFLTLITNLIRNDLGIKELSADLSNLYSKFPIASLFGKVEKDK